uniref:TSC22 domain family protein 1 n=1 Tax=Electrophorus electricus TaxID=8005 RepID=A0AAY5EFR7_ELEEL
MAPFCGYFVTVKVAFVFMGIYFGIIQNLVMCFTLCLITSLLDLFFSSSGASVVAIDNKIEQAMDLVKSHLMYAVREEVEVLKEQIKELIERNSQLEQENNLLKNLASPEQLAQFQAQVQSGSSPLSAQGVQPSAVPAQLSAQNSGPSA